MKVVYCLPQLYHPGGIERIVCIKANYLVEVYGYDVTIITADQQGYHSFYELNDKITLLDLHLDYEATKKLPLAKRLIERHKLHKKHKKALKQILYDIRPDITISTFTNEVSFLPNIKDGSKKILEFHFCRGHKRKMADAFDFPLLTRLFYYYKCWIEENVIIPKYDQFIVLTEEDKVDWKNKIPKVKCISNILPFETDEQGQLERKVVIAVGRIDAQKGFDKLIDLWTEVHIKYPEWLLDIYGEGNDKQKLEKLITTLDLNKSVKIHQPCQDIKDKYLNSSIFVMTSRYEGLPMTLLEATGLGLPVVCYDFKCGPKDVIRNGKNGFLIKENDKDSFVKALNKLMEDESLRKFMGNNAKSFSNRYSHKTIMKEWINLFNEIVQTK